MKGNFKVINDFIYPTDRLAYFSATGILQPPVKAYFLLLDRLWWEEVGDNIPYNYIIVIIGLWYTFPHLLLEILEGLSDHEVTGHPVIVGTRGQFLSFNDNVLHSE